MSLMRLEQITKRFGSGDQQTTALKQIDLTIEKGNSIGLTGPSGSGKTTLLTIMGSLQSPSDGQLYFKDQEIGHLTEKERSALRFNDFGFILQSSNLVSFLTVSEQFELVDRLRKTASPNKADDLLKELGVLDQRRQYRLACQVVSANVLRLPARFMVSQR